MTAEGTGVATPDDVGAPTDGRTGLVATSADAFCRGMHPKLVGALRLYLGDNDTAGELAQDALVRVIERWDVVSVMANPAGWTYRVAFNLARSRIRRRQAERRAYHRHGADPAESRDTDVADGVAVRAAVATLASRQRQVVVLRYFADLTTAETAEVMECRPGTVKAHLHQALVQLRQAGLTGIDPSPMEDQP